MIRPVEEITVSKLASDEGKVYLLLHGFGFHNAQGESSDAYF